MGGLRRKPIPPRTKDEIASTMLPEAASVLARHFRYRGKRYTAYFSVVPELSPGTLVATSYWCAVIARGHTATADELAAALDTLEAKRRSSEGPRGGA
jgi:hypothetical protein